VFEEHPLILEVDGENRRWKENLNENSTIWVIRATGDMNSECMIL
jgi:hypothetical protein